MARDMKPSAGPQGEINKAAARTKAGTEPPKSRNNKPSVGNETKADMAGGLYGQPTDKNPLHGAMRELKSQHPHSYDDHGPHHSDSSHVRHMPLAGMKPYGRG